MKNGTSEFVKWPQEVIYPCDRQNRVTKPTRWTEMEQLLNFQCTEGIYI